MADKNVDYEVVEENVQPVGFELSVVTLPSVKDNREAFFKSLDLKVQEYKDLTFTEENAKEGKATLAYLRKQKDLIDEKRKSIKNEILKPYEEVETFCNQAKEKIDSVIDPINKQMQKIEQDRIEKKQSAINTEFESQLNNLEENMAKFVANCEFIKNPSWINATYTMNKVASDIQHSISKILNDIDVLKTTLTDKNFKAIAMSEYVQSGDVSKTIQKYNELVKQRDTLESVVATPKETPSETVVASETVKADEATYHFTIEVEMTDSELKSLIGYFKANNVHGKVLKKEKI